jgi:hypothetical protein
MFLLSFCLWASGAVAGPCPKIDPVFKDIDGIPFCPEAVNNHSAFSVFRCALNQANSFHNPTPLEKGDMKGLLTTWKQIRDDGKDPILGHKLMGHARRLDLQVCRAGWVFDGGKDQGTSNTYLLFYTKPKVKDYSGPFLILRETEASRFVILGPHDDSDGTHTSTKRAIQDSKALALVSNGHKRGNIPLGSSQPTNSAPDSRGGKGDWSHESIDINLGTYAVKVLGDLYPQRIWLMVHGMKNDQVVLYRVRNGNKILSKAWEQATTNATGMANFNPRFNADFHTEPHMNSNWYIKVEYPASVHRTMPNHLADAIRQLEEYPWAWDKEPLQDPIPEPEDKTFGLVVPEDEREDPVFKDLACSTWQSIKNYFAGDGICD